MFEVQFNVVKLASNLFIATCNIGGIPVRGGTRDNPVSAAQSLFLVLGGGSGNTDDALIAVSLMMQGTDLQSALLSSGE